MRNIVKKMAAAACLVALTGAAGSVTAQAADKQGAMPSPIEAGKAIAFDRKLGNCLACHQIAGGTAAGTIGPPLVGMKHRYPDKAKLRAQIWDSTKAKSDSPMPPFGRNRILTEKQIDEVTDFIYTL